MKMENKDTAVVTETPNENLDNSADTYKTIIQQQQEQIELLKKQNELNKQVQEQLNETLNQRLQDKEEAKKEPFGWIRDKISKCPYEAQFNIGNDEDFFKSEQLATWYAGILREQYKGDDAKVAQRLLRMFKVLKTGIQPHESI